MELTGWFFARWIRRLLSEAFYFFYVGKAYNGCEYLSLFLHLKPGDFFFCFLSVDGGWLGCLCLDTVDACVSFFSCLLLHGLC